MNAITPENEMPPAHSTAANGTFPTEQTNASAATIGPTSTFSISRGTAGQSVTNSVLKKLIGSRAMNPAIRKPPPISFQSISQSPRKLYATSDQAVTELNRSRHESPSDSSDEC